MSDRLLCSMHMDGETRKRWKYLCTTSTECLRKLFSDMEGVIYAPSNDYPSLMLLEESSW